MKWWIKVLGAQIKDLGTSLAVMEYNSPIFCINSTQRRKTVVYREKINAITQKTTFLQSLSQDCFIGIPEVLYNNAYSNTDKPIKIYGPKMLTEYVGLLNLGDRKIYRKYVTYDLIRKDSSKIIDVDKKVKVIPIVSGNHISYIIHPYPNKPKFKINKAKELNLTINDIKMLTTGKSIRLPNGKIIEPSEMHETAVKHPAILTVYCNSLIQAKDLINNDTLRKYIANTSIEDKIYLIYHSVSSEVLLNPMYLDYLKEFGNSVVHIVDCRGIIDDVYPKLFNQYYTQILYECNSRIFPHFIGTDSILDIKLKDQVLNEFSKRGLNMNTPMIGAGYSMSSNDIIKPVFCNDDSIPIYMPNDVRKNIEENPELKEIHNICEKIKPIKQFKNEPFVVFLGTSGNQVTKSRSSSSIYINIPGILRNDNIDPRKYPEIFRKSFGILADCGHGTYGQIMDHFSNIETIETVIRNLKVIFISHSHSDHCFGLGQLLEASDKILLKYYDKSNISEVINEEKLYLIVPDLMI